MRRDFWSHGFSHRFEHSAEIAVGGEDRRCVLFERSAHNVEAAKERIEFLLIRRAECSGVDRSCFGVGFPFDFERILGRRGTYRGDVAFLLAADVRGFAAPLGTEACRDLVPLARHSLDDFLRDRRIVFAALKTFVQQFDPEVGDLLTRALSDLFLDFAASKFDIGNGGGKNRAGFLQLLVAHRFPPFGYANDFDQIMRGDCSAGFAAENVVQARQRAPLIIEPVVVEHRIAESPPGETINDDVEFIFGRTFGRRPVPGEDAFVEPLHFIEDRQLHFQPGRVNRANDLSEPRDDDRFVLMARRRAVFPI